MPINSGYTELAAGDDIVIRVYYDRAWLINDPTRDPGLAPLANGPRGWCLDMTNRSGRTADLTITGLAGGDINIRVAQGDPVTSGPASGRSRTAAQMASLGMTTKHDVDGLQLVTAG